MEIVLLEKSNGQRGEREKDKQGGMEEEWNWEGKEGREVSLCTQVCVHVCA